MDTVTSHQDRESIQNALIGAFSSQHTSMPMGAISDETYITRHIELSWFIDAIKRAANASAYILDNEVNTSTSYSLAHDKAIDLITQKLSSCTLGFDINHIIALSGEMQEKSEAKDFFLVILPYEDCSLIRNSMVLEFSEDDQKVFHTHTIHAIRKQLNLAKNGGLAVCKNFTTNEFRTVGILPRAVAERFPRFYFSKRLKWEFYFPKTDADCNGCIYYHGKDKQDGHCISDPPSEQQPCDYTNHQVTCKLCRVRYDQGTLMMPITDITAELVPTIEQYLKMKHQPDSSAVTKTIFDIIKATDTCDHGAVIIFSSSPSIQEEAERLSDKRRGLLLPTPLQLLGTEGAELVNRMASIDGAILVDYNGLCYAYGVILDGKAIVAGDADRGARYNSTKAYIQNQRQTRFMSWYRTLCRKGNASFIGIVKSEDGMLNIFFSE